MIYLFLNHLIQAYYGRRVWIKLKKQHKIANYKVVILPEDNDDINYYMIGYLEYYMETKQEECLYLLTSNNKIKVIIDTYLDKNIEVINFSKRQIKALVRFYQLYKFSNNIIIGSIRLPDGNKLEKMILQGLIGLEEAVGLGIYQLNDLMNQNLRLTKKEFYRIIQQNEP